MSGRRTSCSRIVCRPHSLTNCRPSNTCSLLGALFITAVEGHYPRLACERKAYCRDDGRRPTTIDTSMPVVIAPPMLIASLSGIRPLKIGAPSASANHGIQEGIRRLRFQARLKAERLIAKIVANQPIIAIIIATDTAVEIMNRL